MHLSPVAVTYTSDFGPVSKLEAELDFLIPDVRTAN